MARRRTIVTDYLARVEGEGAMTVKLAGAEVERGLALKRIGNDVMTLVGGREIHPINVRVGGFYRVPTKRELRTLVDPLERAREAAVETVRWTAGLDFPERTVECDLVALA